MTQPSMFKTPEDQARYHAAYDKTMKLWPVKVTPTKVATRFAITHVNICGPEGAPALLLIPGQSISSTMWYPNAEALSRHFRIYAMDIPGDMGKTVQLVPVKQPMDFTHWLSELLDGLEIDQAHVAGLSYGGFIALQFALTAPQRVKRLVMMSPAGLLAISPMLFLRMFLALLPFVSFETRQKLIIGSGSPRMVPAVRQILTKARTNYRIYFPPKFKDDQLRSLTVPAMLLMGDQDTVYNHKKAIARAINLTSNIQTALIPSAGHALNFDQPELVNKQILDFLRK